MARNATIDPHSPEWQASLVEMIEEERRNAEARARAMAHVRRAVELAEMQRREEEEEGKKEKDGGRRDSVRDAGAGEMGGSGGVGGEEEGV
ncbi:hypothetical protein LTR86_003149 [Recurvomyces mirabilis]|nr:hypothetical protein LTR86_003149 [Recurvomyces mirabilis]